MSTVGSIGLDSLDGQAKAAIRVMSQEFPSDALMAEEASTATGRYVDLVDACIIDPTKVVRLTLENAVSVAGVLLLTEATMTEVVEPKSERTVPSPEAY